MIVFKEYLKLARLHRPIGIFLLFIPCMFSLALISERQFLLYFDFIILYFIGSILMRSAACVINDIFDRDFDIKVARTKNRPLASGAVSIKEGIFILIILLSLSLIILVQFNLKTIVAGFFITFFVATYPLMKRITYYPQLFLGITINFGVIMMSLSVMSNISIEIFLLYLACIIWTVFYDTIYAFQDIKDDSIIGVKSTAIKFSKNPKIFLNILTILMFLIIVAIGVIKNMNLTFFIINFANFTLLFYKVMNVDMKNTGECNSLFNYNYFFGSAILLSLILS